MRSQHYLPVALWQGKESPEPLGSGLEERPSRAPPNSFSRPFFCRKGITEGHGFCQRGGFKELLPVAQGHHRAWLSLHRAPWQPLPQQGWPPARHSPPLPSQGPGRAGPTCRPTSWPGLSLSLGRDISDVSLSVSHYPVVQKQMMKGLFWEGHSLFIKPNPCQVERAGCHSLRNPSLFSQQGRFAICLKPPPFLTLKRKDYLQQC